MSNSAVLSQDERFRYRLERDVNLWGPTIAFFGVNPSTADATLDDNTVRKWRGFAELYNAERFIVGNVFGLRSTDVNALATAADPVGPENHGHLLEIIHEADVLIPCWGARAKLPAPLWPYLDAMRDLLFSSGKPIKTFGLTHSGDPRHVLRIGYATPLIDWTGPKPSPHVEGNDP